MHLPSSVLDLGGSKKILNSVDKGEIIWYGSNQVPSGLYMIFSVEREPSIPAALFEIWRFQGGYDHYFTRFLANDFALNELVDVYTPVVHTGVIESFTSYRPKNQGLTDKEEFHFDMKPKETRQEPDSEFSYPYTAEVKFGEEKREVILTQWTPQQKVPILKLKVGTQIEVWQVDEVFTMMKILKL